MKSRILTLVVLSVFYINVNAQEKAGSITIGVALIGYHHLNIAYDKEEKYKYDYKSYFNFNVGYERQFKGVTSLAEFTYTKAKFDKYDLTGTSEYFNPAQSEDISSYSLIFYAGKTFNANQRFQFPVYIGAGGDYLSGGPFHNLAVDLAVKARFKFYITNNIGIFAGASVRYGWGVKSRSTKENSSSDKSTGYIITNAMWYVDAGLIIGI